VASRGSGDGAAGGGGGGAGGDDGETAKLKAGLAAAIVSEKPNVKWTDVAGLEGAKEALREAVILPVRFPQLYVGTRKPWKGILLYGPPGTGKSYLAKAVATEAASCFFSVSASDLMSKWQGESEKLVRNLFVVAREKKPSVIFIDEIDSMCRERGGGNESEASRRMMNEFLVQMDGVGKTNDSVLLLGATNVPWEIDGAMRRRFEKRILIPLPEAPARASMFRIHLGDTPHTLTEADFAVLGDRAVGMSGSDVAVVVREAVMEPLRKCRQARYFRRTPDAKLTPVEADPPCSYCTPDLPSRPAPRKVPCRSCGCVRADLMELESAELSPPDVTMEDFLHILVRPRASVSAAELVKYTEWTAQFGMEGS
jgi:vacuolar protein-sorting-associated protein 4